MLFICLWLKSLLGIPNGKSLLGIPNGSVYLSIFCKITCTVNSKLKWQNQMISILIIIFHLHHKMPRDEWGKKN